MKEKIGISVEAQIDKKSFSDATNEVQKYARDTKKALDPKELTGLEKAWGKLITQKRIAQQELREIRKGYDKGIINIAELEKAELKVANLSKETTEAGRQLANYRNTGDKNLSRLQEKFNGVNTSINSNSKEIQGLIEKLGGVNSVGGKAVQGISNAFGGLKSQLMLLGPAIVAGFSLGALNSFRREIEESKKILVNATGASGKALRGLQEDTRQIFSQGEQSLREVSTVVGEVNTRFKLTGEALRGLSRQILDFSEITGTDATGNVRNLARLTQDWGVEVQNTAGLLDILAKASQDTGIKTDQLQTSLTNYGVQLRVLGFSLGESIALLSKFEAEGVNTEAILAGLNKGVSTLAKETGKSIPEAFGSFMDSLKNAKTDAEALALANEVLGARAGPQLALAVREGRFEIDEYVEALKNANGTVEETVKNQQTMDDQFKTFTNSLKAIVIPLFQGLINTVGFLGNALIRLGKIGVNAGKVLAGGIGTAFVALIETAINTTKFISDNFEILVSNIGIAFSNIPALAQEGLNGLLGLVENVVNKAGSALSKIPGVDIQGANIGRISTFQKKELLSLNSGFPDFVKTQKAISMLGDSSFELSESLGLVSKDVGAINNNTEAFFEKTLANVSSTQNAIEEELKKGGKVRTAGEKATQKELEEIKQDALKKELARQESILKEQAKRAVQEIKNSDKTEKEKAKTILSVNEKLAKDMGALKEAFDIRDLQEDMGKNWQKLGEILDKSIDKTAKKMEEIEKRINGLLGEIKKIDEQLTALDVSRASTLGDRSNKILEEELKLQEAILKAQQEGKADEGIKLTSELNKLLEEKSLINAVILEQEEALAERRAQAEAELSEATDLKEIIRLKNELRAIDAEDVKKQVEESKRLAELSPTARFLEEFERKKSALQEEKQLKQQELVDFQNQYDQQANIYARYTQEKLDLETQYGEKVKQIETGITENLKVEAKKRIALLKELELQAIATANAMASAGMSTGGGATSIDNSRSVNISGVNINNTADFESFNRSLS